MNDAFQRFLILIKANFFDWQFYFFLVFSAINLALYFLSRKSLINLDKIWDFLNTATGKGEWRNYLSIAALNFLLCSLLVWALGVAVPQTHDEFGYLLAADTFLSGRIANPTPFSPASFEYFHILVEPVYAAKYPPLQGFFLAAGTLLSGYPIAGVWLSGVLASLAVYWLLRFFFSPAWSLFGTVLWIFAPLNILWLDSYWGGHVAVIGGALMIGAVFRFLRNGEKKYLFIWGAGIFILLNSRLYEAAMLTGILVFLFFWDAFAKRRFGREFYRTLAAVFLMIGANLLVSGFYNYSVTGNPLLLPYRLHHSQYHRTPLFVFGTPDAPKPSVPPIVSKLDERWLAEFEQRYKNAPSAVFWSVSRIPLYLFWLARSPFLIGLFLAGLVLSLAGKCIERWRGVPLTLAFFIFGLLLTTFTGDRFVAPVVCLFIAVGALAARQIYEKVAFLRFSVLSLPLVVGLGFLYGLTPEKSDIERPPIDPQNIASRAELESYLNAQPGGDLVFLETENAFPADARFYVYNRADIEKAAIIFAHKLTPEQNAALIGHFKDRKVWLLKNVDHRAVLVDFESGAESFKK